MFQLQGRGRAALAVLPVLATAALLSPARTAPRPAPPYTCIPLGTLGGDFSHATGVNDSGEVVGFSNTVPNTTMTFNHDERAFVWKDLNGNKVSDPGEMRFLGSYGYNSAANSINSLGEAVGYSKYANTGPLDERAVLWNTRTNPPSMTDLNSLLAPADQAAWFLSRASAINDARQVVGYGFPTAEATYYRPFLLDLSVAPPTLTPLGTLPGHENNFTTASALNSASPPDVVGFSDTGFLFSGNALSALTPISKALGINNAGGVVGITGGHPAYWKDANGNRVVDGSELLDLGTFGLATVDGAASAINAGGLVVGNTGGSKPEQGFTLQHAFRWQAGTAASSKQDLNSLTSAPFVLRSALHVTDAGLIVGHGNKGVPGNTTSVDKAYLLRPN